MSKREKILITALISVVVFSLVFIGKAFGDDDPVYYKVVQEDCYCTEIHSIPSGGNYLVARKSDGSVWLYDVSYNWGRGKVDNSVRIFKALKPAQMPSRAEYEQLKSQDPNDPISFENAPTLLEKKYGW